MTVCIGAICTWNNQPMIIGASDRMLTAGDIEFEPPQPKAVQITPHVISLIAGDSSAQATISANTRKEISNVSATAPVTQVEDMAHIYARQRGVAPIGFDQTIKNLGVCRVNCQSSVPAFLLARAAL